MISVKNLTKYQFTKNGGKNRVLIFKNLSFNINHGEFVVLFGPNGCGKSTLLSILSGIEKADYGKIKINNRNVNHLKAGFVFQNYEDSMLPWRTALGNIELALESQNFSKNERIALAEQCLYKVGLLKYKNRYFYELSGGMKQLIAVCRAFASGKDFLLMDEPFSALDYSTARKAEAGLLDIWQESKRTVLFVSHDIDESVLLADKIIVFSKGPATIRGVIKVSLPRPRRLKLISSKSFQNIRSSVINLFEYEN